MKLRLALMATIVALASVPAMAQSVGVDEDGNLRVQSDGDEVVIGNEGVRVKDKSGDDVTIDSDGTVRAREKTGQSVKVERGGVTVSEDGAVGAGEINCSKNQSIEIHDRRIESDATAIVASGNCSIEMSNVKIVSTADIAVRLSGNASLEMRDCRVEGGSTAVWLSGNAEAEARDSVFVGEIVTRGNSDFQDKGNNKFLE